MRITNCSARLIVLLGLCAAGPAGAAASEASPPLGYHLSKKVPIAGDGSYYDYLFVDAAARRLYVSFGGEVVIFDVDSQKPVGRLTGLKKVHGIASAAGRVFVTDGLLNVVRAFEAGSGKTLGDVRAGANPDAVLFDPGSQQVFAFNHTGGSATVFDPKSLEVAATIPLGGAAEFGQADGKGTVWVNIEDTSELVRIDAKKRVVTARWPLGPCKAPTGLAFDGKNRRLFVGCESEMMAVVNADSGKIITTLPIGPGVDATAFDPSTGLIFNSCGGGDGSLVVIRQTGADSYAVAGSFATQTRAKTLAVDPRTHRVFLTAPAFAPTPPATPGQKPARAPMIPGSFALLVWDR
jgi:hypothetical protein